MQKYLNNHSTRWALAAAFLGMMIIGTTAGLFTTSTLQSARPGLRDTMLLRGSPTYEDLAHSAKAGRSAAFGARLAAFVCALMPEVT